jgi:uncharacterized Zn finger protein (UPF0148 family)
MSVSRSQGLTSLAPCWAFLVTKGGGAPPTSIGEIKPRLRQGIFCAAADMIHISCPQCAGSFSVAEAFPGSRVICPSCNTCLVLALQVKTPDTGMVVKKEAKVITPDKAEVIRKQAMAHVANWLDMPQPELQSTLAKLKEQDAYTIWKIPKGDSGLFREITAPGEMLKKIQRRILDRLLYRIPVSNASHGFVPGRSIVTNARYHLATAGVLLNLDLKDAFPSVSAARVKQLYVRYLKIPLKHLGEEVAPAVLDTVIDMLVALTTFQDKLPQGGPCSGYLLNLACITLDKNLYRLLKNHGESYRYTRYADDITISAPVSIPSNLQEEIQKAIHNCGFIVNPRKAHYAERSKGQLLEVTGLVLEKDKVRIPADKLEVFRAIIHQAAQLPAEQLTPEKKLEVQSIVAFVHMVYKRLPPRIWGPYRGYMDKHGLRYPQQASKAYLDLYPD